MNSHRLLLVLCWLACPTSWARAETLQPDALVVASEASLPDPMQKQPGMPEQYELLEPDGVSLGVAVASSKGILLGEDPRTRVVPVLGYEGERLFLRGLSGGVRLFQRDGLELNLLLAARLDNWDARDLDAAQLAARGIDRRLLSDRERAAEAGLGLAWKGSAGRLGLEVRTDISNASGGREVELGYSFAVPAGKGLLAPGVAVSHWSYKLSDYYYGTLPEEEAAGVPRYRPGGAVVPSVSVAYLRALPQRWRVFGVFKYQWLPSAIVDSPLAEGDRGVPSLFVGVSRSFAWPR
ncbi:MipA/OmpV family protein [Pseudoxanthomonas gei]|uniref:MipA/OmpV family protein n=1 Tax=Pseudoxanthomonas gei TaxID=1383030 RepID=A0ABX0AIM2_9GAMM|nr:MipA/OmpV family protein [Pseudoxanthomonas gei]NDK39960.1 MipA/OmpV family protein [Pseudoxanthomonas gei]